MHGDWALGAFPPTCEQREFRSANVFMEDSQDDLIRGVRFLKGLFLGALLSLPIWALILWLTF